MESINQITRFALLKELKLINNTNREHLIKASRLVLKDESTFQSLLRIAFEYENELSVKAMWLVEYICEQRMDLLAMNFSFYISNVSKLTDENSIRSSAKICNLIAKDYTSNFDSSIQLIASKDQISQLVEICFERLKSNTKIAVKTNALEALFELGKQISWIHYELKLVLKKMFPTESPAFIVKATAILDAISNRSPLHKV